MTPSEDEAKARNASSRLDSLHARGRLHVQHDRAVALHKDLASTKTKRVSFKANARVRLEV